MTRYDSHVGKIIVKITDKINMNILLVEEGVPERDGSFIVKNSPEKDAGFITDIKRG